MNNLLPNIDEYLETDSLDAISAKGLEELVFRVKAKTGLDTETCQGVVSLFFHEIRNAMLRGDIVSLRGLGKFLISSPKNSNNKKRTFPKFKAFKSLIKEMND